MERFIQRKNDCLEKLDKSSKGSWDKPILKLCEKINSFSDYYTTSSCSGRVSLMIEQEKKAKGNILFSAHEVINFADLEEEITKILENKNLKNKFIKFKLEAPILHLACRDLSSAKKFSEFAKVSGWKRIGLISFEKNFVLELNSTEKIEFPIINNGKVLVDSHFLKLIVLESEKKMKKGWEKIDKLVKIL
jgi:tRNA wybutosine-synthesizing protein 3